MRDGASEWVAFGFGGGLALIGETEPHGFNMAAGCVFGGGGITKGDGFYEVLMFLGQDTGVREVVVEALLVKGKEAVPDGAPGFFEHGNIGEADDGFVEFEVCVTKGAVVAGTQGFGEPLQDGAQLFQLFGRGGGMSGSMAGGEAFQHRAKFRESAQFGGVHDCNMRNRASGYAAEVKGGKQLLE